MSGWRPRPDWHVVSIDLQDVAAIAWHEGKMTMEHWRRSRGVRHVERQIALEP